ncbi:hypothetical protein [Asticcacaulis sp. YBE204]|uniref:hypothetical protein n=1 Tax=Asticcacaulis sp. YBE204 TaxID=1282363 RepID=UPI0003C40EC1|nr:hypothetical protein [Asticcacaulis sp. YBE204]ESQ80629.1 hypothetical protein AEYBE204_04990 [Asticcacaulis sp. YBE204]
MIRTCLSVLPFAAILAVAACSSKEEAAPPTKAEASMSSEVSASASSAADVASDYVGRWTGPEGTSLEVTAREHDYVVSITNLDGPKEFTGTVVGNGIQIERDGQKFLIQHSNGAQTGMKWLADKRDCVTVTTGEGYCRD